LAILRRAFTLAVRSNLLPRRPPFPLLAVDNARQGFFEPHEFEVLLTYLRPELRPMLRFAYLTGWRIPSEVLALRWSQVDFAAGVIRLEVGTTKNGQGRTFPFDVSTELEALLRAQRADTDTMEQVYGSISWVFHHRGGKPIKDFREAWSRACKAAGLEGRIPHDLRRSAVRRLERAGVSRSVAMQLTGHKTETVYRRYAIVNEADLREGVAKLNRLATEQQQSGNK
jgi:integrase